MAPSNLWTIVPVRGIEQGKSRLARVLDQAGRARLNQHLLTSTLDVIGRWRGNLSRCVVVSPCQRALETAARLGAAIVQEEANAGGLNAAAALGASHAARQGADSVLILPCDLPYLTPEALSAVAHAAATAQHVVIAPDKIRTGTNALLVGARCRFEFRYGEGSYSRHLQEAAEHGYPVSICLRPELEFDLDTPEDFAAWQQGTGTQTETSQTG
ncbi:MAG TPA: 2-phospho-L-lactate guanylyltransferase [Burkholderiales bacterium]|nr:2-phospho-L-lactate guanylyltransferase [Burkholderiales bacterium]